MLKVLIVEDDVLIADILEQHLEISGFEVCGIAMNIAEGLALAAQHSPALAVVDVRLADGDLGTDLAEQLKRRQTIGILYATGNVDMVTAGAVGEGCLRKPFTMRSMSRSLLFVHDLVLKGFSCLPAPDELILLTASQRRT